MIHVASRGVSFAHQRGDRTVVRISDGESGLSARTIARRLSSISGFYAYLIDRGDAAWNRTRCHEGSRRAGVADVDT
jgi:integrase/recombinase XerD